MQRKKVSPPQQGAPLCDHYVYYSTSYVCFQELSAIRRGVSKQGYYKKSTSPCVCWRQNRTWAEACPRECQTGTLIWIILFVFADDLPQLLVDILFRPLMFIIRFFWNWPKNSYNLGNSIFSYIRFSIWSYNLVCKTTR